MYLGSADHATAVSRLHALGVTALLNVSTTELPHLEGFRYMTIPVSDNCTSDLAPWFKDAIQFIGKHLYAFLCLLELVNFMLKVTDFIMVSFELVALPMLLVSLRRFFLGNYFESAGPMAHWQWVSVT